MKFIKKNRATILIADDNPGILRLIKVNLQFEGFEVICAADGREALNMARRHRPDLIILDIMMPEMDGWEVLSNLKKDDELKNIPVILLTGVSVSVREGKERGLIEGVEDFLTKPFNPLRLIKSVEDIVSSRQMISLESKKGHKPIKVALIGQGESGIDMVQTFSGSSIVDMMVYCDLSKESSSKILAQELGIKCCSDPREITGLEEVDLIIDTRDVRDDTLKDLEENREVEILQGLSVSVFRRLLEEQEVTRRKERTLVKELNSRVRELSVFNEMAQILTSSLDLWILLDKITGLVTRVTRVDASTVLIYDEEMEKFVSSSIAGLTSDFKDNVKLSLSDSLVEEIMTLRRPLIIQDFSQIPHEERNILISRAVEEEMQGAAAVPLFSNERLLGIIVVFSKNAHSLVKERINLLSILAGQAGIAVENALLYESARSKQILVEKLLSKLIQAQEEERKLIAAEIHDTIAQSLVGIHTRIQMCQSLLIKAPEKLENQLEDLKLMVGSSVKEVRQIIFNLRPSTLDDLGLVPSLGNYIKKYEHEMGIKIDFMTNVKGTRLPPVVETATFRIIQEALTNIRKHSGADKVLVWLDIEPKNVNLRVADNGKGFDWKNVTEKFIRGDSHGVQGMKERVSLLGGTFKITSEEGNGCIVSAMIPLNRKSENDFIQNVNMSLANWMENTDSLKGVASLE